MSPNSRPGEKPDAEQALNYSWAEQCFWLIIPAFTGPTLEGTCMPLSSFSRRRGSIAGMTSKGEQTLESESEDFESKLTGFGLVTTYG